MTFERLIFKLKLQFLLIEMFLGNVVSQTPSLHACAFRQNEKLSIILIHLLAQVV